MNTGKLIEILILLILGGLSFYLSIKSTDELLVPTEIMVEIFFLSSAILFMYKEFIM